MLFYLEVVMRLIGLCFFLMLSFVGTPITFAQEQEDANTEKAKGCYERGQRLYDLGNYPGAIEEFKQGFLLSGLPAFLLNMGQAYKQLGDNINALEYYKRYLAKIEDDDPTKPSVEKVIAELEAANNASRTGPQFDSGLSQEELKATLGPKYPNYVASGLTYEGYKDTQKGNKIIWIGGGVLVASVLGGVAIAIAGREEGETLTLGGGIGGTLILVGAYGGGYTIAIGSKLVKNAKLKQRKAPF
jgi:tetratricopeptide (TPR) repeat protein